VLLQRVLVVARGRFIPAHHHARQRFFPLAAVDLQGLPDRVLAPQRSSTASDLYDAGVDRPVVF
jgi:hypothetical protein